MKMSLVTYRDVLQNEIELLKSRYLEHDTGHLRTAVSVLEARVQELKEIIENRLINPTY